METWGPILSNLASGSIGVLVTLALTGWWNWRDRRETRQALELQEIFSYIQDTNEIMRSLAIDVEFATEETSGNHEIGGHALLRTFQQTEERYVRLASIISDQEIIRIARGCLDTVGQFHSAIVHSPPGKNANTRENVEFLNHKTTVITRAYSAGNRKISKRVVKLHGPEWA